MADLISSTALDLAVLHPAGSTHPAAPTALQATYTVQTRNANQRAVRISWTAPAATPDLAAVQVWRNDVLVAEVAAGITQYVDQDGGDADFATYYLVSQDVLGNLGPISDLITNFTLRANTLVDTMRRSLKDDPPDPRVRRWTDDDLLLYLNQALSDVNVTPLQTTFTLQTLPQNLFNLLVTGARIFALESQAGVEAAKEFNMGVGGISMNIDRSPKYQALAANEKQSYEKQRDKVKLNFLMSRVHGEGIISSPLAFKIRTFAPRQFRIR